MKNQMKRMLTVCLSMLLALGLAVPSMAAAGDVVSAAGILAELGSPFYAAEMDAAMAGLGSSVGTTLASGVQSSQPRPYTHYNGGAEFAADTDMGTVVTLQSGVQVNTDANNPEYAGYMVLATRNFISHAVCPESTFILETYFKVPQDSTVTTYLFGGTNSAWNLNEANYTAWSNAYKPGIKVTGGYVYLNGDSYANAINATALDPTKWYRILRVMDSAPASTAIVKEKVLILEKGVSGEFDTVVAETTEMTNTGFSNSGTYRYATLAFEAEYPADYTGTEVQIGDVNIYYNPTHKSAANVEGSGRTLAYDASGADIDAAPIAETLGWVNKSLSQSAHVTFFLPEESNENATLKLFRWNISDSYYAGIGTDAADSFAVTVRGGKVYANVYNQTSTLDGNRTDATGEKTYTKLVETAEGSGAYYTETDTGLTVTPGNWYTIELRRNDISSNTAVNQLLLYEGSITRASNGTVSSTAIGSWGNDSTQLYYLPYISDTSTTSAMPLVCINKVFTFAAGYGFSSGNLLYIDAMNLRVWQEASFSGNARGGEILTHGVLDDWTTGWLSQKSALTDRTKALSIGDTFQSFRRYNSGAGSEVKDDADARDTLYITYDAGFLLTGKISSRTLPAISVQFTAPIGYTDGLVQLTDASGEALAATASYDASTNTVTLTATEQLAYNVLYTLNIGAAKTNQFGFSVPATSYSFRCVDLFSVTSLDILDGSDTEVTAPAANGTAKAAATLFNGSGEERSYVIICAVYKDNQMKDIRIKKGTIAAGATLSDETQALTIPEAGCTVKAMVWDSWTNIQPKIEAVVVPQA